MGDPYLSSDESLILSTHNIRIEGVSFDLMLTSRRLIRIDNSVNPFQLHTIPLETIITVVAGTDVKGDPIITVSHMDISGSGAPHPMDFIFTRQKGEQRVKECTEWAAILSKSAAGARDEAFSAGTLPYDPVKVIQPRMSATYRIETFSPRRPVIEEYPVRGETIPLPVPQKTRTDKEIPAGTDEPVHPETGELFEPFDSSVIPAYEPGEPETPDAEERVSPVPEFITDAEENLAVTDAPRAWAGAIRTVRTSLPFKPPIQAVEATPAIETVEGESPADADQNIAIPEEPVSPPQVIPYKSDDKADENPVITEVAQEWADAVNRLTTPQPFTPPIPALEPTPAVEAVDGESPADTAPVSTPLETPVAEMKEEIVSVDAPIPACPADDKMLALPAPETVPVLALISPPAPKTPKRSSPSFLVAAMVVLILVVLGVAFLGSFYKLDNGETAAPVVAPVITVPPASTPIPTLVPADGVWVRIESPQTFIGEVGNPGLMHPVYGSGVHLYKILRSDRLVEVSAKKGENTGDTLLIEVYNNGTLIKRSSTRVPMGSIHILIDPITGQPPGIGHGDNP